MPPTLTADEFDHVTAAMALWEAVIDNAKHDAIRTYLDMAGWVEARAGIARLSAACEAEWEALSEDKRDTLSYDREWCPHFVMTRINWDPRFSLTLLDAT